MLTWRSKWICFSGLLCTQIAQLPETRQGGREGGWALVARCVCRYILNMQIGGRQGTQGDCQRLTPGDTLEDEGGGWREGR